jgi:hypothetical protein
MTKNQKGFSAVEGLLIAVIVCMLGGVGWYVWHSQQQADKAYSQTANSSVALKKASSTNTSAAKYLVIKEWGVKLPLSSDDVGANYVYDSAASLSVKYYDGIILHDQNFDQVKGSDGNSCKGTDLYFIVRAKTTDVAKLTDPNSPDFVGDTSPADYKAVTFTKDYEFAGGRDHVALACAMLKDGTTEDKSISLKYNTVAQALEKSYSNMQAE